MISFLKYFLSLSLYLSFVSLFLTSLNAQEVWLNSKSRVYHCPGTQWFANTKSGRLIKESDARTSGYRPAYGRPCFSAEVATAQNSISQSFNNKNSVQVWVNSKSHVYHCPGSRYFQGTKNGYMEDESVAIQSGNRPAYGRGCS
jgi:hypothetical protein